MGGKSSKNQKKKIEETKRSGMLRGTPNNRDSWQGDIVNSSYMGSRTSLTQPSIFQDHHGLEDFSHNFDFVRNPFSGNDNTWDNSYEIVEKFGVNSENIVGLNFDDNIHQERPLRRHLSLNENRFQLQYDDYTMRDYQSVRCNSMIDLRNRGFLFEGQYSENIFTHYSNLDISNDSFCRRKSSSSGGYDRQAAVGKGGIKRSTWGDNVQDPSLYDNSNDGWEDNSYVLDSPDKPHVKRRQSGKRQSDSFFLGECSYRSQNERHNSDQSFYSDSSTSSNGADSLRVLEVSRATGDTPIHLDEDYGALDILSFPSEWSSFAVDKTGYVNISLSSPEGKSIVKFFNRTNKSCLCITGIVRVENPFLHTLYLLKKKEMAVRNGHVDELFLYHGTKKMFVTNICENNLDWRQYSEMHRFGKGVSFSPSATYSSHYSDEKANGRIMILFKVLVSNCVEGSPEMEIPLDTKGVSYDTSIKEDASVIVKYNDNEFYPLYKIIYKKK